MARPVPGLEPTDPTIEVISFTLCLTQGPEWIKAEPFKGPAPCDLGQVRSTPTTRGEDRISPAG